MKRFAGESTFVWFLATVTNVNDPDKLGLCQVRIDNFHEDYEDEDLPWAMPMMPATSPSTNKSGTIPTGLQVGSRVVVFYADGDKLKCIIHMLFFCESCCINRNINRSCALT